MKPAITPPPAPRVVPRQCSTGQPVCGQPARLTPAGWRCPAHLPANARKERTT